MANSISDTATQAAWYNTEDVREESYACDDCDETFTVITKVKTGCRADRWVKDGDTFYGNCPYCNSTEAIEI